MKELLRIHQNSCNPAYGFIVQLPWPDLLDAFYPEEAHASGVIKNYKYTRKESLTFVVRYCLHWCTKKRKFEPLSLVLIIVIVGQRQKSREGLRTSFCELVLYFNCWLFLPWVPGVSLVVSFISVILKTPQRFTSHPF